MDQLDIRILRELFQAFTLWPARPGLFSSYREIARKLGVAPGTVRNRVREMSRTGFLQGTAVYANPAILGLESGSFAVEIGAGVRKEEVIRRLSAVPGIVFFENFHGRLLGMGVCYERESALRPLLNRVERIAHSAPGMYSRVRHPTPSGSLTTAEWRLIDRLMAGNVRSYVQLARELQMSTRTLKRRLRRLIESGAVLSFPLLDFRSLPGGVTAELLVSYAPDRPEARVRALQRLDDWMIYAGVWEEFDIYRLILPNVAVAAELAREIQGWEGIRFARVELVEGLISHVDALRPYVLRQMAHRDVRVRRPTTPLSR